MVKYIGYGIGAVIIALVVYSIITGTRITSQSTSMDTQNLQKTQRTADALATFASGCFWCMEATMQETEGVVEAVSGYAGGEELEPTYEDVYKGKTGHREAVQVHYDSSVISYDELLAIFWQNIDPTDAGGQFSDRGLSYTTAIFYHDDEQQVKAEASKKALAEDARFTEDIATLILPYTTFYPAEDYHQDFYQKSKERYKNYKGASGRKEFKDSVWADILKEQEMQAKDEQAYVKPSEEELQRRLTDEQYQITQHDGTEKPYENAYWDNKEEGIYVDVVTNEPLFSSTDKYDSNTGWPSFTKPIKDVNVVERPDLTLFLPRTEVRSASGDSHLGHVFDDGPAETGGQRYCINSASLNFIPRAEMEEQGFGAYLYLFEK